jgi:hypothetical protein
MPGDPAVLIPGISATPTYRERFTPNDHNLLCAGLTFWLLFGAGRKVFAKMMIGVPVEAVRKVFGD